MPAAAPTYDLVLIIDPQAEDNARAKIVADSRASIEAKGELLRHDEWGERALTYPIDKHASGEYHLLQFHAGESALLEGLDRTLRITDGVLRFRIVKLKPGVPEAPDMRSAAAPPRRTDSDAAATPSAPAAAAASTPAASEPAAEDVPDPATVAADPAPAAEEPAPVAADPAPASEEPARVAASETEPPSPEATAGEPA